MTFQDVATLRWIIGTIGLLTALVFLYRDERLGQVIPLRRVALVALLVVLFGAGMAASEVYTPCDWDSLLNFCNGWDVCAWIAWWNNGCGWR